MKINWKVRLKNPVFLTSAYSLIVNFVFDLLALLDIVPPVTESMVMSLCSSLLTIFIAIGVLADPTTAGLKDSERAMTYDKPAE